MGRFDDLLKEVEDDDAAPEVKRSGAGGGGQRRLVIRLKDTREPGPSDAVQELTMFHFFRGAEEFWIGGEPGKFPSEYCRVAKLRSTFANAFELCGENEEWPSDSSVVDKWTWTHYKNENNGYRLFVTGDVMQEADGRAWRCEGSEWSYVGSFPGDINQYYTASRGGT